MQSLFHSRRSTFLVGLSARLPSTMPGVDYDPTIYKPPRGDSGTEHRDQYKSFKDATTDISSASKAPFALGPEKTSALIGLPWCESTGMVAPAFAASVWAPVGVPAASHFQTASSTYGSMPTAPFHKSVMFEKAKESASVRYLQAPYLAGAMGEGAGLDARPVSSVSTFSLASDRQAEILASAEQRLGERAAQTASWTMSRSLKSQPITAVPDPYLTTTNKSFQPRPSADSQQHRLRGFTTSAFVPARSLNSTPMRVPTAPLDDSSALHGTRYVGVRDSDGGRRLIEVDTTGAPAATAPWKLPTMPSAPPEYPPSTPFVSSHPTTTNDDTVRSVLSSDVEGALSPLPRSPLPPENVVSVKHRRPFAMGYSDGFRTYNEYRILETQKQAATDQTAF